MLIRHQTRDEGQDTDNQPGTTATAGQGIQTPVQLWNSDREVKVG
jgi:hypothetical protein